MSPLCGEVGEKGGTQREKEESPLFSKPSSLIITVAKKKKATKTKSRALLAPQFRELRSASASDLLYVKEDCILPQDVTFHELISRKARGKSGPLFHFDVRDDVRLQSDATKEKDESHAGKIVTRAWYGRNKHMFPASRWEVRMSFGKREKSRVFLGVSFLGGSGSGESAGEKLLTFSLLLSRLAFSFLPSKLSQKNRCGTAGRGTGSTLSRGSRREREEGEEEGRRGLGDEGGEG